MENPALDLLMRQPFPELAAAVRSVEGRLLDRFRTVIKEVLPSADELTLKELLDHVPQTLEHLAGAIGMAGGRTDFLSDSRDHGVCRYHQSFNLSELLVEYSVLRSILMEEVTLVLHRPLKLDELSALNAGLDAAVRRGVESFVKNEELEIQRGAEAQSKYLSYMSHDLRGSLNGILLVSEVLKRELAGFDQFKGSLEDIDLMRRSVLETVGTMDRFLHAEKFRRGKVEVRLSPVNLALLVPDIVSQFSQVAKNKGVEILADTSHFPEVISDRELLILILQNLISNAVKYSNKGAVKLAASVSAEGECKLSISDNGPGISPEVMSTLFEPFTRGRTHGQSGLGLGLSIARQAADLLKAKLWVESAPGDGSTFFLQLPAANK